MQLTGESFWTTLGGTGRDRTHPVVTKVGPPDDPLHLFENFNESAFNVFVYVPTFDIGPF